MRGLDANRRREGRCIPFQKLSVFIIDALGVIPDENSRTNPKNRIKLAEMADYFIKTRIAGMLDVPANSVKIEKDKTGAPYLAGYQSLHISKSYIGRYAVCAVSTDKVGIDIEYLRSPNCSIAKRYFKNSEIEHVFGYMPANKAEWASGGENSDICRRWTQMWTLKEAYGKHSGHGLEILNGGSLSTISLCAINNLKILDIPVDDRTVCTVVSRYSDYCAVRIQGKAFENITGCENE